VRIAYLAAGAAGMYCGSCLHDNTLAAELLRQGHDVVLVPIYTPIRTDEKDVSLPRVFFGGINVYLQQRWALFRRTPRWLDKWLDHPALLRLATRGASAVDPADLGDLTVSMLKGEEGNQRKELEKLVDWLIDEVQPEVVHLSNSMMVGLAPMIARKCGPPVVCSLSGEDIFLEKLKQPHYDEARQLLRERAGSVHAFVALNNYFADFMADYLAVPHARIEVIPHGLNLEGHGYPQTKPAGAPLRIGYLARICHDKGLHLLVEACELLAKRPDVPHFELHAAGYLGAGDQAYFQDVLRRVSRGPLADRFHYAGELDRSAKIAFLQSLDVFSTPTVYQESKGLPALEALANGVPVVLPRHGSFPEIVETTGGGRLFSPHDVSQLAETLGEFLRNDDLRREMGKTGRIAVHETFHAAGMAERTVRLYERLRVSTSHILCS
jgi:glycosyltransferase involved in cell wall biosynthesis